MGGGEERAGGRRPFVAQKSSPLTEVAAAAGDDLFGSTSERGVDAAGGRRRQRCSLLQMGWLSFSILPFFEQFIAISSYLEIDSICLLFIEFFVSILGSSKWFTGGRFLSGEYLYFPC